MHAKDVCGRKPAPFKILPTIRQFHFIGQIKHSKIELIKSMTRHVVSWTARAADKVI